MERKHSHHQQYVIIKPNGRLETTTRHFAALSFLTNISMNNEQAIRQRGQLNASKLKTMEDNEENNPDELEQLERLNEATNVVNNSNENIDHDGNNGVEYAGKKLHGPIALYSKYPPHLRYHLQRLTDQSVLVRQWEDQLLAKQATNKPGNVTKGTIDDQQSLLSNRIFFSNARSYPLVTFSIVKYDAGEEKARIEKLKAEDQKGFEVFNLPHRDWRGFSYKFKPMKEEKANDYYFSLGYLHDPIALDDPNMLHGSHRYVLQRSSKTGPIFSSIIFYVNKQELKESLNAQFREKHPHLPPSLTLSKIRNIKKMMITICDKLEVELSTVAITCINFERLCLKGLITKLNRKLTMAVCLLLAYKFNETVLDNIRYHKILDTLFAFFDTEWDLSKKEILEAEFGCYVHLGFLLHIPYQHVKWMYNNLLKILGKTSRSYLKEDMYETYKQDLMWIKCMKETAMRELREQQEAEEEQDKEQQDNQESTSKHNNNSNKME